MAVNTSRNMNAELVEGATDGGYKKVVQNRGGIVEPSTADSRAPLDDVYYGFHEINPKDIPGMAGYRPTPNYVPTREADSTKW